MTSPAYERPRVVSDLATVVLQANPGPMTLDGTNTWILRGPDASTAVLVDPGDLDDAHLSAVLDAAPPIELVLVTHRHHDHAAAGAMAHERTGAPVRAADRTQCHGGTVLVDGETITAAGLRITVLATPGHTDDSVSFVLPDRGGVLTGDTILGRGTTVVAHPDGVLGAYLDSLHRLGEFGGVPVLPGHGPTLPSLAQVAGDYLAHRAERLEQVRAALAELGDGATARAIVETVYADVDPAVWWAAELSVQAQLDYLRDLSER